MQHTKNPGVSLAEGVELARRRSVNTYVSHIGNGGDLEDRRLETIQDQDEKRCKHY